MHGIRRPVADGGGNDSVGCAVGAGTRLGRLAAGATTPTHGGVALTAVAGTTAASYGGSNPHAVTAASLGATVTSVPTSLPAAVTTKSILQRLRNAMAAQENTLRSLREPLAGGGGAPPSRGNFSTAASSYNASSVAAPTQFHVAASRRWCAAMQELVQPLVPTKTWQNKTPHERMRDVDDLLDSFSDEAERVAKRFLERYLGDELNSAESSTSTSPGGPPATSLTIGEYSEGILPSGGGRAVSPLPVENATLADSTSPTAASQSRDGGIHGSDQVSTSTTSSSSDSQELQPQCGEWATASQLGKGQFLTITLLDCEDNAAATAACKEQACHIRFLAHQMLFLPRVLVHVAPRCLVQWRGRLLWVAAPSLLVGESLGAEECAELGIVLRSLSDACHLSRYYANLEEVGATNLSSSCLLRASGGAEPIAGGVSAAPPGASGGGFSTSPEGGGDEVLTAGNPDASARLGNDGRWYLSSLPALFPSFPPARGATLSKRRGLRLRQEAVTGRWCRERLSPAAFLVYGSRDSTRQNALVREFTQLLCQEQLRRVARELLGQTSDPFAPLWNHRRSSCGGGGVSGSNFGRPYGAEPQDHKKTQLSGDAKVTATSSTTSSSLNAAAAAAATNGLVLWNGASLSTFLHRNGLNIGLLGLLLTFLTNEAESFVFSEMIARVCRDAIRYQMSKRVELDEIRRSVSEYVSHLANSQRFRELWAEELFLRMAKKFAGYSSFFPDHAANPPLRLVSFRYLIARLPELLGFTFATGVAAAVTDTIAPKPHAAQASYSPSQHYHLRGDRKAEFTSSSSTSQPTVAFSGESPSSFHFPIKSLHVVRKTFHLLDVAAEHSFAVDSASVAQTQTPLLARWFPSFLVHARPLSLLRAAPTAAEETMDSHRNDTVCGDEATVITSEVQRYLSEVKEYLQSVLPVTVMPTTTLEYTVALVEVAAAVRRRLAGVGGIGSTSSGIAPEDGGWPVRLCSELLDTAESICKRRKLDDDASHWLVFIAAERARANLYLRSPKDTKGRASALSDLDSAFQKACTLGLNHSSGGYLGLRVGGASGFGSATPRVAMREGRSGCSSVDAPSLVPLGIGPHTLSFSRTEVGGGGGATGGAGASSSLPPVSRSASATALRQGAGKLSVSIIGEAEPDERLLLPSTAPSGLAADNTVVAANTVAVGGGGGLLSCAASSVAAQDVDSRAGGAAGGGGAGGRSADRHDALSISDIDPTVARGGGIGGGSSSRSHSATSPSNSGGFVALAAELATELGEAYESTVSSSPPGRMLAEAEIPLRYAWEACKVIVGPWHPATSLTLNNLAINLHSQGRLQEALALFEQDLQVSERLYGPNDASVSATLNNMACLLHDLGRHDESEALLLRDLSICKACLGERHPDVATALNNLGATYLGRGLLEKGEECFRQSLSIRSEAFSGESSSAAATPVAEVLYNLGVLLRRRGACDDVVNAREAWERCLTILRAAHGEFSPKLLPVLEQLCHVCESLGEYGRSEELMEMAFAVKQAAR